ncbi:MAG: ClpXP protease specificity-enhancing factor SspB [Alphaproteobacteria bacterium]|nr:ClpXP protease specificity-enhancing factor SspB [Alphaproteobacteria bacterium]
MSDSTLRYDRMVEEALRDVVRSSLNHAAEHGLPGEHHFYITFRTTAPGVDLHESLYQKYPEEMTIVLQHQFWDLKVQDDRFQVTLSFGGVPRPLTIPLDAVTAFFDPSVQFGLKFEVSDQEAAAQSAPAANAASNESSAEEDAANVITLDAFRKNS